MTFKQHAWLYLLPWLLILTSCKTANRSRLQTVWFTSGTQATFVYFENGTFFINSCPNTDQIQAALGSEDNLTKARSICSATVTSVPLQAMQNALTKEILGPASSDLIGTKKQRVDKLTTQIEQFKTSIAQLSTEINQALFDASRVALKTAIDKANATLKQAEDESLALKAAASDPEKLKLIDINATLSLQSVMASTADQQATVFAAMLRDVKIYALTDKRDSILIKIIQNLVPTCTFSNTVSNRSKTALGIETVEYECQPDNKPRIIATTCSLEGYERIDNYCVFTGKDLKLANFVATESGVCGAAASGELTCWGRPGLFPMNLSSLSSVPGNKGSLPTTKVFASKVAASSNQLCTLGNDGKVLRCWDRIDDTPSSDFSFKQITGGERHFCGVTSTDNVRCWGDADLRQTNGPGNLNSIRYLSTSENVSCATDTDNLIECWGERPDSVGSIAMPAPDSIGEVLSMHVGAKHACAVLKNRTVKCWDGTANPGQVPPSDLSDVRLVAAGRFESCAVTTAGALRCWGKDASLQNYSAAPSLSNVADVVTSRYGSNFCAIYGIDRKVACWGSQMYDAAYSITPPADLALVKDVVITTSGYACAVLNAGNVRCWGNTKDIPADAPAAFSVNTQ